MTPDQSEQILLALVIALISAFIVRAARKMFERVKVRNRPVQKSE